jgi:uncharacterized protein (DUF433 family)
MSLWTHESWWGNQSSKGISVEMVIDLLAAGWSQQQILDSYPSLKADDVRACLAYASEILHSEKVFPLEPA